MCLRHCPPGRRGLTPVSLPVPLQVFVWVGKDSQEEEKTEALSSGEQHVRLRLWVPR